MLQWIKKRTNENNYTNKKAFFDYEVLEKLEAD